MSTSLLHHYSYRYHKCQEPQPRVFRFGVGVGVKALVGGALGV